MGPLIPLDIIPDTWNNVIAVAIGIAFGFIMEGSGFSSSRKIVGLFYGYDFTVLKVFFTAAVTSAIGLLYFGYFGWLDLSLIYIHPTYLTAAIVGGLVMGIGFVSGGYCPGTSLIGAGIGRIDGMVFTVGLMLGIFFFSETFTWLEGMYEGTGFFAGDFLGYITITEYFNISPNIFIVGFTIVAVAAFYFTNLIRKRVKPVNY
ncbi:MAG: YeeE/YedE family protein [Bacteroidales bacterium]|nr:YeeE/YedE family protein [Bacteroidales bacterium]